MGQLQEVILPSNSMHHLKDELHAIDINDIKEFGLTLSVRERWYVRLSWLLHEEQPDIGVIDTLMDSRPELLTNLVAAPTLPEVVKAARALHDWTSPRGYAVGISGISWLNRMHLRIFDWLGGFN